MKFKDLKDKCELYGLSSDGNANELEARLIAHEFEYPELQPQSEELCEPEQDGEHEEEDDTALLYLRDLAKKYGLIDRV